MSDIPDCICERPGYCPLWNVHLTHHLWSLCRDEPARRALWKSQGGPYAMAVTSMEIKTKPPPEKVPLKCLYLGPATGGFVDCITEH